MDKCVAPADLDDKRAYPVLVAYGAIGTLLHSRSLLYDAAVHRDGHCRRGAAAAVECPRALPSAVRSEDSRRNYVPFMVIPGLLCIDMVVRTARLLQAPRTAHAKAA